MMFFLGVLVGFALGVGVVMFTLFHAALTDQESEWSSDYHFLDIPANKR